MKFISSGWEKLSNLRLSRVFATVFTVCSSFISMQLADARNWPWTNLLSEIRDELTGPLPTTLGILGIVIAAVGLFTGNAGDGVRRILVIILAISMCIFAPTFVQMIVDSAGG